jgi:uncharacterized protein
MPKYTQEIRDPIHAFVRLQGDERNVLDSRPFQRLRNIHQLATTFLVYPSATHKRFEHSLGVMELAGRVYDVITDPENIFHDDVREIIPKYDSDEHRYWRRVLRMAALCHDVGHLPFSHAAESELLPDGKAHEDLTCALIKSDEMTTIWNSIKPPLLPEDIEKLAVGKRHLKDTAFSLWESVLSEIITGDAFGVDRMDYLLRDSLHTGVGYGRFDHFRLTDTLRMLPFSDEPDQGNEPVLGIELGGLHSAEALIMARYFMFSQVYLHHVRRIYDKHLKDFMFAELGEHGYPINLDGHLRMDDVVILRSIQEAANNIGHRGHEPARRIVQRDHYKLVYSANQNDLARNPEAARYVSEALRVKFPEAIVYHDRLPPKRSGQLFPVRMHDGRIMNSVSLSDLMASGLSNPVDYVYMDDRYLAVGEGFLRARLEDIIEPKEEEE